MADLLHNRFRLLRKCGAGGTGDVYQAEDTVLKRMVALKRVRAGTEPERVKKAVRLLKEAEYLARVDHPNVVMIHDCIEGPTSVTIVMELVKGIPFKDLYHRRALPEHELLGYMRQLVSALEAVHEAGVIHRDVSPRNVLVGADGAVKLTDFGLACSREEGDHRAGGTIGYMPPEALRKGSKIGFTVDIYSLGFLGYQALLGGPRFQKLYGASKPLEWARWILSREKFRTLLELEAPVSAGVSGIIERMLEKDVRDRYQRMADVRKDLERLAGLPPGPIGPSFAAGMRRLLPGILQRPSGSGAPGTASTET